MRAIRELVNRALLELSPAFDRLYAREERPSISPERLLRALLLQAFYTVRSERQLMEQLLDVSTPPNVCRFPRQKRTQGNAHRKSTLANFE
jgi:transposase